jgi:hypothetical protein
MPTFPKKNKGIGRTFKAMLLLSLGFIGRANKAQATHSFSWG